MPTWPTMPTTTLSSELPPLTATPELLGVSPGSYWWRYATTVPSVLGLIKRRLDVAARRMFGDADVVAELAAYSAEELKADPDAGAPPPTLAADRALLLVYSACDDDGDEVVWLRVRGSEELVLAEVAYGLDHGFAVVGQYLVVDLDSGEEFDVQEPTRRVVLKKREELR